MHRIAQALGPLEVVIRASRKEKEKDIAYQQAVEGEN